MRREDALRVQSVDVLVEPLDLGCNSKRLNEVPTATDFLRTSFESPFFYNNNNEI